MTNFSRSILITGSSSGIGAVLAKRLAAPDVNIMLHARQSEKHLKVIAEECRARGARVEYTLADIATKGAGRDLVEASIEHFGELDSVIANAGFPILKSIEEIDMNDVEYAFRGNVQSLFELAQTARPYLKQAQNASITALGSFTSFSFRTDSPQFPASAASKGAVVTAVHSLSLALAPDNIRVNCVVPGFIRKDAGTRDGLSDEKLNEIQKMIPLSRIGEPEDVASAIQFLMSPNASYITGQALHVNGGLITG